jgi:hypothetical protein
VYYIGVQIPTFQMSRDWPTPAIAIVFPLLVLFWLVVGAEGKPALKPPSNSQSRRHGVMAVKTQKLLEAQEHLFSLGYWIESGDAKQGLEIQSAIIAFQKLDNLRPTGRLSGTDLEALTEAKPPAPKEIGTPHVEVDLDHQVLFWVDQTGAVSKILPVSTGSGKEFTSEEWTRGAVTPPGRFLVSKKLEGWQKSPLGLLYYPNFIVGGIAIHGAPIVPTYPASHGCIRIPMFAAKEFSEMTPLGTVVLVYGTPRRAAEDVQN